jgi:hypothetical protein
MYVDASQFEGRVHDKKKFILGFFNSKGGLFNFLISPTTLRVDFYSSKDGWNVGYYLTEDKLKVSRGFCFLVAVYYIWPRYGKSIDLDDVTLSL